MLRQFQSQKLLQRLSPQQIQFMQLLQVPTLALEERVKEEIEVNPALEYDEKEPTEADFESTDDDSFDTGTDDDTLEAADEGEPLDLDSYLRQESRDDVDLWEDDGGYSGSTDSPGSHYSVESDFYEQMLSQVGLLGLPAEDTQIAGQLVGTLDEDGYLRRDLVSITDDLAFGQNIYTDVAHVEAVLRKIQQLDPPGIAARDLQECLLLQLQRLPAQAPAVRHSIDILTRYFGDFTAKHYDRIRKALHLDEEDLKEAIQTILKLNPRPGAAFSVLNRAETYLVPDFFIRSENNELHITLNARNAPELRISEGYLEMIKSYERSDSKSRSQKEAISFIRQKLDAAKWFIDAIRQRQQTLLGTMNAIGAFQKVFFLTGDESAIRPMVLRDVAAITGQDVSTVSRVVNSKYVQTEYGTYRLKFFFSEGHQLESGEEVSTRELRKLLREAIDHEDKSAPLSDEKLTQLLNAKGYNLARRTVAKYREQLQIPVARMRKGLS
ncbi:MAG: RNA polymerase sigma-54 factor [Sphingobacteriales bacterium]|nr:MAG: RNA polymerase sigma-54 factor [Sphingobacteriales bacterium]